MGAPMPLPPRPVSELQALCGTMAHELRNPLGRVANVAHLLRAVGAADPRLAALADILDRQVWFIDGIVQDMLEGARMAVGKARLRYERADLTRVIADALDTCAPVLDGRTQVVEVQAPAALPLDADRVRLQQVLVNLLGNASKFSPRGSRIHVHAAVEDDHVVLTVSDPGKGITPELLPRVFDTFAQAAPHGAAAGDGLGLGLGVVRSIVEMHGGAVEAHSDGADRGTRVVVRLPLRAAPLEREDGAAG